MAQKVISAESLVDRAHDPVVQALLGETADGKAFMPDRGVAMGALSIDLENRDRVKLAGSFVVGTRMAHPDRGSVAEVRITTMFVRESLGNCPKYLNKKTIRARVPTPRLVSSSLPLPADAFGRIDGAGGAGDGVCDGRDWGVLGRG